MSIPRVQRTKKIIFDEPDYDTQDSFSRISPPIDYPTLDLGNQSIQSIIIDGSEAPNQPPIAPRPETLEVPKSDATVGRKDSSGKWTGRNTCVGWTIFAMGASDTIYVRLSGNRDFPAFIFRVI